MATSHSWTVHHVMADRRNGIYAYAKSGTLCYSALLAARGDVDGAVNLMEGLRSRHAPDMALSGVAEQLLLDAGRVDEAYARYGIKAASANTNIATYRAIAKRYPGIDPNRILADLIASTPGEGASGSPPRRH